jgi:hypothetical protein
MKTLMELRIIAITDLFKKRKRKRKKVHTELLVCKTSYTKQKENRNTDSLHKYIFILV